MKYIKKGQKITIQIDQMELYNILSHALWGVRGNEINDFNCSDIAKDSSDAIFEIAEDDPAIYRCKHIEFSAKEGVIIHKDGSDYPDSAVLDDFLNDNTEDFDELDLEDDD